MTPSGGWRRWRPTPQGESFPLVRRFPSLPGLWDLRSEPAIIPHWTGILRNNADYVRKVLETEGRAAELAAAMRALAIFAELLDELESGPVPDELPTIHAVTLVREALLRGHGVDDPYEGIKAREATRLLPDAEDRIARAAAAAEGANEPDALARLLGAVLAGNLFDLGSASTQQAFRAGKLDLDAAGARFAEAARAALEALKPQVRELLNARPKSPESGPGGRLLFFADNAGVDFLLGVLPLAVYWAQRWEVLLIVNSLPVSSDIALAEARAHCARLGSPGTPLGEAFRRRRIRLLPSGTGSPGIDLRYVGRELQGAAQDVSWMVIEGQGRAIETNWETRFRCPVLRIAVAKDTAVARAIGADAGVPVIRWDESAD